ncbi:MAG: hypothetical protein ACRC80_35925 [Waterburya sp.]
MRRLTQEYVKEYLASFGYELRNQYSHAHGKLEVKCDKKHQYKVSWTNFHQGQRCPYCAGQIVTHEMVKKAINKVGYELLSGEYINKKQKLQIECDKNHSYLSSWDNFNQGSRCPFCSRHKITRRMVAEAMVAIGYELLSDRYINNQTKLKIKCDKSHIYNQTWRDFNDGCRCSVCAGKNKEYQYKELQEILADINYTLLSKEYIDSKTKLDIKCDRGHEYSAVSGVIRMGCRCPQCAGKIITLEQVKKAAAKVGSKVLSNNYVNCYSKLELECFKEKHKYSTSWDVINMGCGCPFCFGNVLYSLGQVQAIVAKSGYEVVSKNYKNSKSKIRLRCDIKHIYTTTINDYGQGRRCTLCSDRGGFKHDKPGTLYYAKIITEDGVCYKIGITNEPPEIRLSQLGQKEHQIKLLWSKSYLFGNFAYYEEQTILNDFAEYRCQGNPFNLRSGWTEIFTKDVLRKDV